MINWSAAWLLTQLLPPTRRGKPRVEAFLRVLTMPVEHLRADLRTRRETWLAQLRINASTISLERAINLRFGGVWSPTGTPPITFLDNPTAGVATAYAVSPGGTGIAFARSPGQPGQSYAMSPASTPALQPRVIVRVPTANPATDTEIAAWLNRYRPLSITFTIQRY